MDKTVFVLIHGAWHDATCWDPLVSRLQSRGHQVLAPDLPGHGENPADPASTTLKVYSRYITQFIENIGYKVILVGHSMSGMVISQVAENTPQSIDRLVYLSAYLPCHGQSLFDLIASNRESGTAAPIEEAMHMAADKLTCTVNADDIRRLFYNCCPEAMEDRIPTSFPAQATLPLSGKVKLTRERFGQVPKTYICCLDDRVIPIRHQRHMLKQQPCDEMIQLDTDHSPHLSCPEDLAAILESASLPGS